MRVSPVIANQSYIIPQTPGTSREAFIQSSTSNPYYELSDRDKSQLLTRYHEGKLIDRIYIQQYLLRGCPSYIQNESSEEQRKFLGKQFKCDCTDCDGSDVSRDCLVEEAFYEQTGLETPQEIIMSFSSKSSSPEPTPTSSIDYEEPDEVENISNFITKSRVSLTYEDIKNTIVKEADL